MFRALIVLLCLCSPVLAQDAPTLPIGANCDDIKAKIAEYGRIKAIAWALEHGYSWKQIIKARKECHL